MGVRWTGGVRAGLGLGLVAAQLACGGSCLFGPTCDKGSFVTQCSSDRAWQSCGYNEWTGDHHVSTVTCHGSEACLMADGDQPTCAIHPVETCATPSARRCAGADVHECGGFSATVGGEAVWRHDDTCTSSEQCVSDGDRAGCVASPPRPCVWDDARYRCEGGHPEECRGLVGVGPDDRDPHYWGPVLEPCEADEACLSDGSDVYCVVAPTEPCAAVGETRCVQERTQRCIEGGSGIMGPPTPHWTWVSMPCSPAG